MIHGQRSKILHLPSDDFEQVLAILRLRYFAFTGIHAETETGTVRKKIAEEILMNFPLFILFDIQIGFSAYVNWTLFRFQICL